jgi:peptide/nickel transport system permease protein
MNRTTLSVSLPEWPGFSIALDRRRKTVLATAFLASIIAAVVLSGLFLGNDRIATHFDARNLSPSIVHPFGTDWLGRDMFTRTMKGLTLSIGIGVTASASGVLIALCLGLMSATLGKTADAAISWAVDLFLGVPHLVALILIAFTMGGGAKGVITGVALTHWPGLTRIIRSEVMQIMTSDYVRVSRHMGKSRLFIAVRHLLPHLVPQVLVGFILLFPHAVLHEASITFLGFGLSPHQPAIGVILSESMKYLSAGMWWPAFFPGLSLLIVVRAVDMTGRNMRLLGDPWSASTSEE